MSLFHIGTLCILLTSPMGAQIGGGSETIFEWIGPAADGRFGRSSSHAGDINGDGFDDVIVGMYSASPGGLAYAGSAFVYSGADGSILHQLNGDYSSAHFGTSVSYAGDMNQDGFDDFVVGAPGSFFWGEKTGSAHVFSGADGSLLFQWSGFLSTDRFGSSVSDAGDVNGDGIVDLIVGADQARTSPLSYSPSPGAAYVYSGADGSLIHQFDGINHDDYFGVSVSGAGDVNADGFDDLLVGAHKVDVGSWGGPGWLERIGSAFVYSGQNGLLLYEWSGTLEHELFGSSVSDAGDINGDGFDDVIVGAPGHSDGTGRATVFSGIDGSIIYQWSGEDIYDEFGISVSNAGDVDSDGIDDVIVGAHKASQPGGFPLAGSAYIYSGADGTLLHQRNGTRYKGQLGQSVSGGGDVDGDGLDDVISGGAGDSLLETGAAYVFNFKPFLSSNKTTIPISIATQINLQLDFPDAAANFGYKVLISVSGPGQMFRGVDIPLTEDFMVHETYSGSYPFANYANLHGSLDLNGNSTASVSIAANELHPSLIGRTFHIAAAASMNGFSPAEYSSVAIPIEITP